MEPLLVVPLRKDLPTFIMDKIRSRAAKKAEEEKKAKGKKAKGGKGCGKDEHRGRKSLHLEVLAKALAKTSREAGHAHDVALPEAPKSGTFTTKAARVPGSREPHVHVFMVRPGVRAGTKIKSSRGPDGHAHVLGLGEIQRETSRPLVRSLSISGDNTAQVTGHDSTRRESVDGRPKNTKKRAKKRVVRKHAVVDPILTVPFSLENLSKAATKREAGFDFPSSAFAYVGDPQKPGTWKLRLIERPGGTPTKRQVGMAVAALGPGGFRGQPVQIPAADRAKVKRKVAAAWRRVNPGRELPRALRP